MMCRQGCRYTGIQQQDRPWCECDCADLNGRAAASTGCITTQGAPAAMQRQSMHASGPSSRAATEAQGTRCRGTSTGGASCRRCMHKIRCYVSHPVRCSVVRVPNILSSKTARRCSVTTTRRPQQGRLLGPCNLAGSQALSVARRAGVEWGPRWTQLNP
jgi:hypothetical protein